MNPVALLTPRYNIFRINFLKLGLKLVFDIIMAAPLIFAEDEGDMEPAELMAVTINIGMGK